MKRAFSSRILRPLSLLLCAALMLALFSGCAVSGVSGRELAAAALGPAAISVTVGSAPAVPSQLVTMPTPLLNTNQQIQLLESCRGVWAVAGADAAGWSYAYTDLNRNGRLEVLTACTQGTSSYTSVKCYEVSPTFNGITECASTLSSSEGWPEIAVPSLPCYYDSRTGVCYYVCEDLTKLSAMQYSYAMRVFWLFDGVLQVNTLATRSVTYGQNGQHSSVCRDWAGNSISENDYAFYADRYYASLTKSNYALSWQSGGSSPIIPVNPTPIPTPIPTPRPTPIPTPAGTVGAKVVITKNPTSESLAIGGTTWFIAHANNAVSVTWQAVSPSGQIYTAAEALSLHPGLSLGGVNSDTLTLKNIPLSLNGWGFQARFDGVGNAAISTAAYIYVGDYVTAYQNVLNAYRLAYQVGGHTAQYARQNGLSEVIAHSPHVGYAFKDLNKDGTPELFIGGIDADAFGKLIVYDCYTLVNGVPVRLAVSSDNDRFYLRTDSLLLNGGSDGKGIEHYFLFRFVNDRLNSVEGYMTYKVGSAVDGHYYQQGAYSREPREGDKKVSQTVMDTKVHGYESAVFGLLMTQLA